LAGRTVIAIAHRLRTARDADRIVVMRDGRITEVGSHPELVAADGEYAALWRAQTGS
jgi:ATP-binding cassette subfamily C protein